MWSLKEKNKNPHKLQIFFFTLYQMVNLKRPYSLFAIATWMRSFLLQFNSPYCLCQFGVPTIGPHTFTHQSWLEAELKTQVITPHASRMQLKTWHCFKETWHCSIPFAFWLPKLLNWFHFISWWTRQAQCLWSLDEVFQKKIATLKRK